MAKTNEGLVTYVKSKLNVPTIYMLGGFGRKLTQANIDRRVITLKCPHTIANLTRIKAGIGRYCFDCVGLIKGYLWETSPGVVPYNVPAGSDQGVRMMWNAATVKGEDMNTMPDLPGLLVFTEDLGHVGVYIGKNALGKREYVESTPAFGFWGVGKSNDSMRTWGKWARYSYITYVQPVPVPPTVVEKIVYVDKIVEKIVNVPTPVTFDFTLGDATFTTTVKKNGSQ